MSLLALTDIPTVGVSISWGKPRASMSETQSDKAKKKMTARYTAMMGGIGTAIAIGHIALIGSFPILEYAGS